jgi:PAS domain S-box-containing protein
MTFHHVFSIVLGLLPCLIPPYALRLNRIFGSKRVGWLLFTAFSLLAVLQLLRSWRPAGWGVDAEVTLDLLNFLVPVLLLIGMIHLEGMLRERARLEQEEKRLRADLERQVQERTAQLDSANEEMQHEITLRRQGEAELRKSKEQYRFLFEENPQPMWVYDLNSLQFLAFNVATLRHYGYSSEEFRTMTVKDLCAPGEPDAFTADSPKTSSLLQARPVWRHCKKDGSVVEVELTTLDMTNGDNPARLILVNDVTAQRQLQKQLLQTQKMEVTTQLARGVADNFSRLIAAIAGDADLLVRTCKDSASAQGLKRIAATAGAAAGLTRQMLALVLRHPMQAQSLDLNQLLDNQAANLGRLLGKNIRLEKKSWESLPAIKADPALVGQILYHLLLNARDAMPNGGTLTLGTAAIRVDEEHARSQEDARAGTWVCLTISDTGCGMTPEVLSHLFEPFFTTKETGKAAGLGLATVHGLVKQHGGWLEITTQPGAGTRVAVFFPCSPSPGTSRRVMGGQTEFVTAPTVVAEA